MLERILIEFFNLDEEYEMIHYSKQDKWNKSYSKLVNLIYKLEELGVIDNSNVIIDKLDKIDNIKE